jgi:L-ornithine N5-oxygenase
MAEVQIVPQVPPKTVRIPSRSNPTPQLHDLICIGFGTLGLGLAVALQDTDYSRNVLFLEQNETFSSSTSGVGNLRSSFAHDLATLRNPTSKFTYLNYLYETGRLDTLIQADSVLGPERELFTKYLSWAATQLGDGVRYGKLVTSVTPVGVMNTDLRVSLWAIEVLDVHSGERELLAARNVVFACGNRTRIADPKDDIWRVEGHKQVEMQEIISKVQAMHLERNKEVRLHL